MGFDLTNGTEGGEGGKLTEGTRERMSKSHIGLHPSKEACGKMSESHKGKPSGMLGKHQSAEARQKMSAKLSGRISPMSGKYHSEETKSKISKIISEWWKNKNKEQ